MIKERRFLKNFVCCLLIISALISVGIGSLYVFSKNNLDFSLDEELFLSKRSGNITKFYYNSATEDGVYTPKEFFSLSAANEKQGWYNYEDFSECIKNTFICIEDRNFFTHRGFDLKRTAYALLNYVFHFKNKFGASTITQQLIKNISGDNQETLTRKLKEIMRASHIEHAFTKEEIFEMYLNIIPMGEGLLGIGLASEYYFGKKPSEINYREAATLVGITNAPTKYNPYVNEEACIEKRNVILTALFKNGYINEEEYLSAAESELKINERQKESGDIYSWFIETVSEDIIKDLTEKRGLTDGAARLLLTNGGLSVYTTYSPLVQECLSEYFENISNFSEDTVNGLDYSMVVVDSRTQNLLGIVGSVGKKEANRLINNATVPSTPASTLKPLALYAPIINKKKANWATVYDDSPTSFTLNKLGEYVAYPKNSPEIYDGLTTLSGALCRSKNTVAVKLYNILGKRSIFNSLKEDFGFNTIVDKKVLANGKTITDLAPSPLALGQLSYGISLRQLTEAYSVFPSEGIMRTPKSYFAVYTNDGKILINKENNEKRVFSTECARIMNQMLMRVTDEGTASAVTLKNTVDTAGKTGTAGADRGRLFIGYTPYLTAGIRCAYTGGNKSIGYQSISHIEIWDNVMKRLHEKILKDSENPISFSCDGLLYLPYCKDSGKLFCDKCLIDPRSDRLEYGYFTADNKPIGECDRHTPVYYDVERRGVAEFNSEPNNLILISLIKVTERSFPVEVFITDAEYVYREVPKDLPFAVGGDIPFFQNVIPDGEFVGKSKGKKQFNSSSSDSY